jgi:hypothetical protein
MGYEDEAPQGDRTGTDRRDLLKKLGIGVGAAWVAPTVLSTAAGAQGSDPDQSPTNQLCAVCGTGNLVQNADAENGLLSPWFYAVSPVTNEAAGAPYPVNPSGGTRLFRISAARVWVNGPPTAAQNVTLGTDCDGLRWRATADAAAFGTLIGPVTDPGTFPPGTYPGQAMLVDFYDSLLQSVGTTSMVAVPSTSWTTISATGNVPAGATSVQIGFWVLSTDRFGAIATLFDNVTFEVCP